MSPELKKSFERMWPEIEARVRALLMHKGVPSSRRDDIVQETGLRLFTMWERVDQSQPPAALGITIALNLLRDEARRYPHADIVGVVPDVMASDDVERAGIARAELHRVKEAMDRLSASRREVLLAEVGSSGVPLPTRGAAAIKMLRMRARRELHALLDKAQGIVAVMGWNGRRGVEWVQQTLAQMGPDGYGTQAAAAGGLIAVAILLAPTAAVAPTDVNGELRTPAPVPAVASMAYDDPTSAAFRAPHRVAPSETRRHQRALLRSPSNAGHAGHSALTGTGSEVVEGEAHLEGLGTSHEVRIDGSTVAHEAAGVAGQCSTACDSEISVRVRACIHAVATQGCVGPSDRRD